MPYSDPNRQQQAQHESYLRNVDKVKAGRERRRAMLRKTVDDIKSTTPCEDCKVVWPVYVTDYHHREPNTKEASISRLVCDLRSVDRILAEIEKCELLCSNCHRIREYSNNTRFVKNLT